MPTPFALPAMSEVTELLMNKEEPAKQELAATRSGSDSATRHTHSHTFLPHIQEAQSPEFHTACSRVSVQKFHVGLILPVQMSVHRKVT